jgi:hypothetical protein
MMIRIVDGLPVANLQDLSKCGELPEVNEKTDPNAKYTRPDGFPIGCAETKVNMVISLMIYITGFICDQ